MATVHRTAAFTWVRVCRYFRCGRQDSITLWSTRRRAAGWQQSTGLLHLHGFEPVAISGAGDRTRLHYGASGVEPPDGNSPPDCCIFIGSNPAAFSTPKIGAPLEGAPIFGAGDRTRTCTAKPEEPKSTESTNSTTPACCLQPGYFIMGTGECQWTAAGTLEISSKRRSLSEQVLESFRIV